MPTLHFFFIPLLQVVKNGFACQQKKKTGLQPQKTLWNMKSVVHSKLLVHGRTITADIYCYQLNQENEALCQKRPALVRKKGIIFSYYNAKSAHCKTKPRKKKKKNDH